MIMIIIFFILLGVVGLIAFLHWQNNGVQQTNYEATYAHLPPSFHGYKIVHLSDLHGKCFGPGQKRLVRAIASHQPDRVVFTGDLIDRRRYDEQHAFSLIRQLTRIAPVYFVMGNHEYGSGHARRLEKRLKQWDVTVLRNDYAVEAKGRERIFILGMDDFHFFRDEAHYRQAVQKRSASFTERDFVLLLAHRPEKRPDYQRCPIDLALTGHVHGGQIRLPFIGGLYAPDQGVFPRYSGGMYRSGALNMVVNRGLGNSLFPQRLFNRPEIVLIELKKS